MALATVPMVGLAVVILLLQVSSAVVAMRRDEGRIALSVQTALDTVNRSCGIPGKIQPCGTLAEIDKVLTHSSDLIIQSQLAVRHADRVSQMESAMLPAWNSRFTATLEGLNNLTATFSGTAQAATMTLGTAGKTIAAVQPVLEHSDVTVKHLDDLIHSPDITDTIHNIADTTKATAQGSQQAAVILADGRKVADRFVNPPPQKWYMKILTTSYKAGQLLYDFIR